MCGWLSVAALPPLYLFPVLFISFSSLLYLIYKSSSPKQAFACGYAFGFAFFAFGLSWIGNALLIDHTFLMWLYPVVFLACGFFFGLFMAVPALLCRRFQKPWAIYLSFCSLVVIFEWLRSFFLTGFPWNLFGSVFAFSDSLIQVASVGGTYLLSLLALLIFSLPFLWLSNPCKRHILISSGLFIILLGSVYGYGYYRLQSADTSASSTIIRLVQPAIPQTLKWHEARLEENFNRYIELSKSAPLEGVSAVLWGETASPFPLDLDATYNAKARAAIPPSGYLITGQIRYFLSHGRQKAANSMLVFDAEGNTAAFYDKSHLVPFGEYIPLRQYLPSWLKPLANTVGTFSAGFGPDTINLQHIPSLGAIICYEAIFPHQIIDKNNRPQWLINPTNDGWYGNSFGPHQHLVATRLRAIEEGITIARIANTGISALISPYGGLLASIALNTSATKDVALPQTSSFDTPYSRMGNNLILIICIVLLSVSEFIKRKS